MCGSKGADLKMCAGCSSVGYCCAAAQKIAWPDHRKECKRLRKIRDAKAAKEAKSGDYGDLLNVLSKVKVPERYELSEMYNACHDGRHEEVRAMMKYAAQEDIDCTDSETGSTATFATG
jgi:hypothetical protein